jgi:hypothetical protein
MIDGSHAPAGSLYSPIVISVLGCTTRRPASRHQRNSGISNRDHDAGPLESFRGRDQSLQVAIRFGDGVTEIAETRSVSDEPAVAFDDGDTTVFHRLYNLAVTGVAMHLFA